MRNFCVTLLLFVAACSNAQVEESDSTVIANRAEALERAADATTDTLIAQIEADSASPLEEAAPNSIAR